MPLTEKKEADLIRIVKKQKNNKAAGIDGVRAEAMKHMVRNKKIRKALVTAFNRSLKEKVNRRWLESYTTMLLKNKKPKNKEHRPIAVTCWSSKIMCTFLREKIEIHLETWGYGFEIQYGFTEGGRGELCLFIVNYIANRMYESQKKHKVLYYAMVDFKMAYGSVNRQKLIDVMAKYEVNTRIIEMIMQIYVSDRTTIKLGSKQETIDVICGIRQGCNISTLLFKMVTFSIIEELEEKGWKYEIDKYKGNSL